MDACLIQVPYVLGDDLHAASRGPERLLEAGLEDKLRECGIAVCVRRVTHTALARDPVSTSLAVNKRLAPVVEAAVAANQLPVVLAGSCDIGVGVLAGFDHSRCGVIWVDAHGDFNTPESTITGFFPGMSLAVLVGHCHQDFWARIGNSLPVPEEVTLLVGVRELDPAEEDRLRRSLVQVVSWRSGKCDRDLQPSLDQLASRVQEVYLHIDLDALDPAEAPGIVDRPVPGGLSLDDVEELIREVAARFRIRAATLATFNPERDSDGRTSQAAIRLVTLIAAAQDRRRRVGCP